MVRSRLSGGRKGNMLLDSITVIVVLIVFGIVLFLSYMVLDDWNTEVQADNETFSEAARNLTADEHSAFPNYWDSLFITILVFLWVAAVVASFFIDSHPIFFIISVVAFIFIIIASGYMSNAFMELAEDSSITSVSQEFPKVLWVFDNLVVIIMVYGLSIGLSLYAKVRAG